MTVSGLQAPTDVTYGCHSIQTTFVWTTTLSLLHVQAALSTQHGMETECDTCFCKPTLWSLQVFSTKQWAMFIVHAYPFFPGVEAALENTCSQSSEPTMQQIIADARANPMSQEWSVLDDYLCRITGRHPHGYEPIPRATYHSSDAAGKQVPAISLQDMLR